MAKPNIANARIAAHRHRRRAGVIGTAAKAHDVTAQSDDAGHDTDIDGFADQPRALLDMRFEIGAMAIGDRGGPRAVAQSELRQPIDQPLAGLCLDIARA